MAKELSKFFPSINLLVRTFKNKKKIPPTKKTFSGYIKLLKTNI